jgi:hypothetical protein
VRKHFDYQASIAQLSRLFEAEWQKPT